MSRDVSLRHEVVLLVVAGAALGIAHNVLGLTGRPARGIPWLAVKTSLANLEDLTPADSTRVDAPATPPGTEAAVPEHAAPAVTKPSTTKGGGAASPSTGGAGSTPAAGGTSGTPPAAPAPDAPPPPPVAASPDPRRAPPLPFIPDSDQPIQLQVATVKRFFDARAALFLDARDPAEYGKGHIPGAIRLTNPEAQSEPERLKALPVEGRPTIVYCEGGTCEASLELARFLIDSGFRKVLVYMGGYPEWEAAGHPVERGAGR